MINDRSDGRSARPRLRLRPRQSSYSVSQLSWLAYSSGDSDQYSLPYPRERRRLRTDQNISCALVSAKFGLTVKEDDVPSRAAG